MLHIVLFTFAILNSLMPNRTACNAANVAGITWSFNDRRVLSELTAANLLTFTPHMLQKLEIAGSEYVLKLVITKNTTVFGGLKYRAKINAPKIHPSQREPPINISTSEVFVLQNAVLEKLVYAELFALNNETYQLLNIEGGYFVVTLLIDNDAIKCESLEYRAMIEYKTYNPRWIILDKEFDRGGLISGDITIIKNYNMKRIIVLPNFSIYNNVPTVFAVFKMYYGMTNMNIVEKIIKYKRLPVSSAVQMLWIK